MKRDEGELDGLADLLASARTAADRESSIAPEVARRVETQRIERVRGRQIGAIAVVAFIGTGIALLSRHGGNPSPGGDATIAWSERLLTVQMDSVELDQQVAAVVGGRMVVVVWSCRGAEAPVSEPAGGHYQARVVRQLTKPDGSTVTCTVFVPTERVRPVLEPPLLRVRLRSGQWMAVAAVPQACSREELSRRLQGLGGGLDSLDADLRRELAF